MDAINATHQFGLPTRDIVVDKVHQQYDDTCAIKSQELVLHSVGLHLTEEELRTEAMQHGWYTPGGGTPMENVGALLENHGLNVEQTYNASIFHLVSELGKGHPIIVGVDSGELWHTGQEEIEEDLTFGPRPDHALIVGGIEFNDDFSSGSVNLIDPGSGDYCKSYDLDLFQDAWDDSGNFMVSIL